MSVVAILGRSGQAARALVAAARAAGVTAVALGRPDLDLTRPATILPALAALRPSAVINAAGWTAVDAAEADEAGAFALNAEGAGAAAAAAAALGAPLVHLSSDYVFDGGLGRPLREDDATAPLSAYGRSKLAGEARVRAAQPDHAILRTQWLYDAEGRNFPRTMLALARTRATISVVADQRGAPTAADALAAVALAVARRLIAEPDAPALRGTFHATSAGETTWAEFAEAIFARSAALGGPVARVLRIASTDYPSPARRPADARLDCGRLAAAHGLAIEDWRAGLDRLAPALVAASLSRP